MATTCFEILSLPFELATNDKKFFNEFLELNAALVLPADGKTPVVRYSVIKNAKYFCISENGSFRRRWAHRWPLYLFVMMCVRDKLYLHLKNYLFLHSGAVVKGDKAILLAGPSGSGKSTLTLGLLNYGYKYLTDEVVVISLMSREAIPFQRPVYVYGWLPTLANDIRKNFKFYRFKEKYGKTVQPWQYVVPKSNVMLPKHSGFEVEWIIFPRYNETQRSSCLRPISRAEAVLRLIEDGWNILHFHDRGLKVCSELVKKADCYQLDMGDLKEACELIERLVGKTSVPSESEVLNNIWKRKVLL